MYILDENDDRYIKCGVNGTIVGRIDTYQEMVPDEDNEDEEKIVNKRSISVRQGLEKKKVLKNIKMDLPDVDRKVGIDPENTKVPVFGLTPEEDLAFVHKDYIPGEIEKLKTQIREPEEE